ncbi:hypothetical protein [Aminobacterium colombiense]|jgi:hypothetical protein|uniref:hypothetical protein n=2 Tax=Aminobacterium TaxID=81466 RepID=UPI002FDAF1D1
MKTSLMDRYETRLRTIGRELKDARDFFNNEAIQPSSSYIMQGISGRYEITCLKRLMKRFERDIRINKDFDLPTETLELALEVAKKRWAVVNSPEYKNPFGIQDAIKEAQIAYTIQRHNSKGAKKYCERRGDLAH